MSAALGMATNSRHLYRFVPPRFRPRACLDDLANRLSEANFVFERQGGVLIVRAGTRGRVEFQKNDTGTPDDFRADVYGQPRVLIVNLVTALQVYQMTAHFHWMDNIKKLQVEKFKYGRGLQ